MASVAKERSEQTMASVAWRCWPLLLGNLLEWYDYGIYGYLAIFIGPNFFPESDYTLWVGYATAFIARPLGGLVLGCLADKYGRRFSLNISIYGMIVATVCQGLLPTYRYGQQAGHIGVVLMIILRLLQGLSAGGEVTTIDAYILEVSPIKRLGVMISLVAVIGNAAYFLANGVSALVDTILGDELMIQWGWRIPFLLALPPGLIAAWGRRSFKESEEFEELQQVRREDEQPAGVQPGDGGEKRDVNGPGSMRALSFAALICIGGTLTNATCRNVAVTWTTSYLKSQGLSSQVALWAGTLANLISTLMPPLVGWLTDVKGVGWVQLMGSAVYAVVAPSVFALLSMYPTNNAVAFLGLGVAYGLLVTVVSSTFHLFCVELFPTHIRATALGLFYNIGQIAFGGCGPWIAQALYDLTPAGPAIFMSLSGLLTALAVLLGLRLQHIGLVQLAHRRPEPYFGSARCSKTTNDEACSASNVVDV